MHPARFLFTDSCFVHHSLPKFTHSRQRACHRCFYGAFLKHCRRLSSCSPCADALDVRTHLAYGASSFICKNLEAPLELCHFVVTAAGAAPDDLHDVVSEAKDLFSALHAVVFQGCHQVLDGGLLCCQHFCCCLFLCLRAPAFEATNDGFLPIFMLLEQLLRGLSCLSGRPCGFSRRLFHVLFLRIETLSNGINGSRAFLVTVLEKGQQATIFFSIDFGLIDFLAHLKVYVLQVLLEPLLALSQPGLQLFDSGVKTLPNFCNFCLLSAG
mmetsp:Transcript_76365/g.134745  ORF Transcript_76365/g.134745 Transcript_76365/m.134745 type:complete len:269 (-) Transcript_76365:1599-2405(-)